MHTGRIVVDTRTRTGLDEFSPEPTFGKPVFLCAGTDPLAAAGTEFPVYGGTAFVTKHFFHLPHLVIFWIGLNLGSSFDKIASEGGDIQCIFQFYGLTPENVLVGVSMFTYKEYMAKDKMEIGLSYVRSVQSLRIPSDRSMISPKNTST